MASHPHQILPPSPLLTGSTIEGAGGRKEGPRPTGFGGMGTLGRPNRPPHASPRGRPLGPSGTPHAPLPVKLRPPLVWKSMDGGRPAGRCGAARCSLTSGGGGPAAASSLSAPCAHRTSRIPERVSWVVAVIYLPPRTPWPRSEGCLSMSAVTLQVSMPHGALFGLGKNFGFWYRSIFVCLWQILSNRGLTRLKKIHLVIYRQTVQLVFIFAYISNASCMCFKI
jgi:hypothetical protein